MTIENVKITLTNGQEYKLRKPEELSEIDPERTALFVFDNQKDNSKAVGTACPGSRKWSAEDAAFVREHFGRLPVKDIAAHVGRTVRAVNLYCYRHKLVPAGAVRVKRNMLVALLRLRFRNLEDFTPSRAFYDTVRMTQKRYWDLFFGRSQITGDEYCRIADYMGITMQQAMEARQLDLFDDCDNA